MLRQNTNFIIVAVCYLLSFSCKPAEKAIKQEEPTKTESNAGLASNEATIVAKIISLNEQRDETGPCAKVPCYANIKIESINNQGSLFRLDDSSNPFPVYFAFTLSSTEGLFPGMKTNYPGLKINDKFEAKIQSRPALGDKFTYTIYGYKKLTKP
jgi:hypothetical protein